MITRRQFFFGCSTLSLAASFAPFNLWSAATPAKKNSLDEISFEQFAAQSGTRFKISAGAGLIATLELVEAKITASKHPLAQRAEDAANEKFSLLFRGRGQAVLTQDTYFFKHADLGQIAMFIVPVKTKDTGGVYYQAIFNRPKNLALKG